MDKEILNYIVEKTHELINASSCSNETKNAAQIWLDSIGNGNEVSETKKYFDTLEEDIMPIDDLINFAESDHGTQVFGEDTARKIATHGKNIKSDGAKYCDCPACTAALSILEKKDALLN